MTKLFALLAVLGLVAAPAMAADQHAAPAADKKMEAAADCTKLTTDKEKADCEAKAKAETKSMDKAAPAAGTPEKTVKH